MSQSRSQNIRNIAIIAHVDHGKTTLVDALLKQSHIFRANQEVGELIMDSNPLERERGITILAKNTAVNYEATKINIIDTPGHADFSGEVERVINMADGCLLLIDAVDGPMPQTRYVLKKALARGATPIVVINKIDAPNARPEFSLEGVHDLFLDLATDAAQLDFPVIYTSARDGYARSTPTGDDQSMSLLFESIVNHIPAPTGDPDAPFQMLVTQLAYDSHIGQIAIGRISNGQISIGDPIFRTGIDGEQTSHKATHMFVYEGLDQKPVSTTEAGEIVALAGASDLSIGDILASESASIELPNISIDQPTVRMTFGVNTSPFSGKEGTGTTARQLYARLKQELQTNVSLKVDQTEKADEFLVSGRGELHLAILIETMRREGYEFQVSKPEAITTMQNETVMEPYEMLMLDTREEFIGALTTDLSMRLGRMSDMNPDGTGNVRMTFRIPTRGLIGFNSFFVRATHGQGTMTSIFDGFDPMQGIIESSRSGVLVASQSGVAIPYGLNNAQDRGAMFIGPGMAIYEGMIVGSNSRTDDINVNVCKEKKLTNIRSAGADEAIRLTPPVQFSIEEALDFIASDELVEVTPKNIRLRKRILGTSARHREQRDK